MDVYGEFHANSTRGWPSQMLRHLIVHYATSAMKRFLTSVSLQHEPKASDVITLVKKTFFARVSYEILYHEVWNKRIFFWPKKVYWFFNDSFCWSFWSFNFLRKKEKKTPQLKNLKFFFKTTILDNKIFELLTKALGERKIFTLFFKYFHYRLFVKCVKDFLILYDKIYIK